MQIQIISLGEPLIKKKYKDLNSRLKLIITGRYQKNTIEFLKELLIT